VDILLVSSFAEVASAMFPKPFLLMSVGTFKARGNVSLLKFYDASGRILEFSMLIL
jgi:hypothetical protein